MSSLNRRLLSQKNPLRERLSPREIPPKTVIQTQGILYRGGRSITALDLVIPKDDCTKNARTSYFISNGNLSLEVKYMFMLHVKTGHKKYIEGKPKQIPESVYDPEDKESEVESEKGAHLTEEERALNEHRFITAKELTCMTK